MTTTSAKAATTPYEELAAALRGDLITPSDAGYGEARAVYNAMIDKHRPPSRAAATSPTSSPACASAASTASRSPSGRRPQRGRPRRMDDALVIDLSLLRSTTVSPRLTRSAPTPAAPGDVDQPPWRSAWPPLRFLASTGVAG